MIESEEKIMKDLEEEFKNKNISFKEFLFRMTIESIKIGKAKDQNKPFLIAYKNIVEKTAAFLNSELLVEDPITASIIFEYLLWNGYFSTEHFYEYRLDQRVNRLSSFGADIMRGQGVCLNNATMLADVLRQMDYNACLSLCYAHENANIPSNDSDTPLIERNYYSGFTLGEKVKNKKNDLTYRLLKPLTTKLGNHAIVLNEYNGKIFAIDPTNLCFMTYKDDNVLTSLNGTIDVNLKKIVTLIFNGEIFDKVNDIYEKINNPINSSISFLDKDFIKDYYDEMIDYCKSKENLLEDLHQECKSDIKVIRKNLVRRH